MAVVAPLGVGTGLVGNYFTGDDLQNLAYTRRDAVVNFNWGRGSPNASLPADYFSARWVGKVQAQFSEPYTFRTIANSGARLWVNGEPLVDDWTDRGAATENAGTIELRAGELYDIKMEFRETAGNAVAKLLWSSPSTEASVVPSTQLYSTGAGWVSGNWLNQDLGSAAKKGSVRSAGGTYTIQGAGAARLGGTSDQSHFVYQTLNGDGSIVARLSSVAGGTAAGRAGLMFRDSLANDAAFAALCFNPAAASRAIADVRDATQPAPALSYRARRGVRALTPPGSAPAGDWVRLVRDGNYFRAYTSTTGADGSWQPAGTAVVPMGRTVYVGLTVNSGDSSALARASFADVSIKPTVPLGAGLDSLRDWNLGNVFVDTARQARAYQSPNIKNPLVPLDAAGWPAADFSTIFQSGFDQTGHVYKGTYKVSFTGQAELSLWNSPARVVTQSYDPATNTTSADVFLDPPEDGGWYFGMNFTETRRSAGAELGSGVTNLRVIRPGYAPDTTQVFTNEYLRHLEQFSVLRFMSFTNTNNNPVVNWADRSLPTDPRQSTNRGVAWEYVIDIANQTGKDVWINVPGRASDDYVRNLAALFKERLNPGRVVYVEYSNEVWNYQFDQAQFNLAQAKAEIYTGTSNLNNDNTLNSGHWGYRRHARRTKEVGEIFAAAFGAGSMNTRIRPVLGAHASNSDSVRQPLAWLEATYGPPSSYLYGVAIAPYFGADGKDIGPAATPDGVLDGMESSINKRNGRYPMYYGLAARYGLRSMAYEGGSGTEGKENLDVKIAALNNPRMRQVTADYLNGWYGTGGDLFEWFMAGPTNWTSQYGQWGLTNAVDNFDSPKLQGTIDVATGPKTDPFVGISIPGQLDARYHTNPSTPFWRSPAVDPYVRYLGAGATFDYVVRAPVAGTYYLRVSAAAVGGDKPLEVYVNDRKAPTITVPDNGTDDRYDKFVDSNSVPLTMREGVNLVRLVVPSTRPYNLDSLKFSTSPGGSVGDTMPVFGGMAFSNAQTVSSNNAFTGAFNLFDAEDGADGLTISASSDNPALFPEGSLVLGGAGSPRTLRVAPAAEAAGSGTVFLAVADSAGNTRSVAFTRLTVRPSAPGSLLVNAISPDQAELSWNDNSSNETAFRIDQSVSPDFRAFQTFTVPAGSTSYLATDLKANTLYYYRVRAVAAAAGASGTIESSSSAAASDDTPTFPGFPTTPGRAAASPGNVTGTTTTLSALGDDDGGEPSLTYFWQVVSAPSSATGGKTPTFSANGTNAAKTTTVTFFAPGAYTFCVAVTDAEGNMTPSHVDVNVASTLTRVDVLPNTPSPKPGGKLHFFGMGKNQFGADLPGTPFTWSSTGGQIESTTGQFTAPATPGTVMVTATSADGLIEGTALVAVGGVLNPPPVLVRAASASPGTVTGTTTTLSAAADDDGGAANLRYTWAAVAAPAGAAAPVFSANGTTAAATTVATFAGSGLYSLRVTISDGSLAVTSAVAVDVRATPTSIAVSPATLALPPAARARFTATVSDQFGAPLAPQPPVEWSVDGAGTVDAAGVYAAPAQVAAARVVASAPLLALSGPADVMVTDDGTVAPLLGEDIGPVPVAGSDSVSADGTYTVSASGLDIFTAPDAFRFLHRTMEGDATLVARVAAVSSTDAWTKAGLMIRESTAPDAKFAYVVVTPRSGVSFGRRTAVGGMGGSNTVAGPAAPTWIRLTRAGNSFSAFYSADGQAWTQIGSRTIAMGASVEVGLCLTARDESRLATATFDNVSIVPAVDLALGRPVMSSSAAIGLETRNVVDGHGASRWESLPGVAPGAEQWVRVDLGKTQRIGRVRLNWGLAYASGYLVQTSDDGAAWTDLYSTTLGDGNADDLLGLNGTGRYVRLFAHTPAVAGAAIALNDFNVFTS